MFHRTGMIMALLVTTVLLAGLLPADAQAAVLSDRPEKVLAWLEGRAWWQALRASPVWVDLSLSGPLRQLSTLRHRVAAASPVPLQQPSLGELMVGPVGLAMVCAGRNRLTAAAAFRPAPMASMTVADPVTMSPPANTPRLLVAPVDGSATL